MNKKELTVKEIREIEEIKEAKKQVPLRYFKRNKNTGYNNFIAVIHSVSSNGMSRKMSIYTIDKNEIICINNLIHNLIGTSLNKDYELVVHGAGMDMIFNELYYLFRTLYPTKRYQEYNFSYRQL